MKVVNEIALRQMESRFKNSDHAPILFTAKGGWIRQMRLALGMTLRKLAESCGVSTATIAQIEARENEGRITIETLRKVAESMNCNLVYAFVPKSEMKTYIEKKAYEKAKRILLSADLHMSLEDQQVKVSADARIEKLKRKLINEGKIW